MRTTLAAILILASCGGCSTLFTLTGDSEHRWLYSGTRNDVMLVGGPHHDCVGLSGFVGVLDMPWSLALDTALVPVTLPLQLILGSSRRKEEATRP